MWDLAADVGQALCVVDGAALSWLAGDREASIELPLVVWAAPGPGGGLIFTLERPDSEEAECVESLVDQLVGCSDVDLLDAILAGFFEQLATRLPEVSVSTELEAPPTQVRLLYPCWLGPQQRGRLRRAAKSAGIVLQDGIERGLAPVLTRVASGDLPPHEDGWVVADSCSRDVDVYVVQYSNSKGRQTVRLQDYRRGRDLLSGYYDQRPTEQQRMMACLFDDVPAGWRRLATSQQAAGLLERHLPASGRPGTQISTFSEYLDSLTSTGPGGGPLIERRWRYWLDHGDQRLAPLKGRGEDSHWTSERLLALPAETPSRLTVAVHAGFTEAKAEAHELCRLTLSKPDYYTAQGHLLISTEVTGEERGSLTVEAVQHGRSVFKRKVDYPNATEEP